MYLRNGAVKEKSRVGWGIWGDGTCGQAGQLSRDVLLRLRAGRRQRHRLTERPSTACRERYSHNIACLKCRAGPRSSGVWCTSEISMRTLGSSTPGVVPSGVRAGGERALAPEAALPVLVDELGAQRGGWGHGNAAGSGDTYTANSQFPFP
eukprot:scaffold2516_cov108-Isochrysis_galbana.AAC.9